MIRHVDEVLQLLTALTQDDRFEKAVNAPSEKGGVKTMCEVLDRIEARGVAKGMVEGKAEGLAEGEAKGLAEGEAKGDLNRAKTTARRLQRRGESLDDIADILDVSVDTVSKWLSEPHATPAI